ncbi:ArsR/SmtB family transcription factor [Halorhabdus amylolytica]|uniref:ArsR/SmtB family transcription factor n=1 Tax=Halorhabdus amylolytica TaxID=2559573 RepID=UPI0010AB1398|nr:helix-turn-helix domain-containing protein [Halorhabdus amylolytica]
MSLLPSEPDTSATEESNPRVIGVDSDAADDLIAALSSETAREILTALHEESAPPSELADRVDTSLQNVQYHLENLAEAGAVEVVDTVYSEKGREMDVYAPADRPLVIFAGEQSRTPTLRQALSRLLGGIGVLALASVIVQSLFGNRGDPGFGGGAPPAGGNVNTTSTDALTETAQTGAGTQSPTVTATETAVETPMSTATETAVETATATATETVPETATEAPTATATRRPIETATEAVDTVTTAVPDGGSGLPPGLLFFAGGITALVVIGVLWYVWG